MDEEQKTTKDRLVGMQSPAQSRNHRRVYPEYTGSKATRLGTIRIASPSHNRSSVFSKIAILLGIGIIVFVCLAATGISAAYVYYQSSGRIYPGIYAGSVDLSGMTVEEAAITIQKNWELDTQIRLTDGTNEISFSPAELGLLIDPQKSAQRAFHVGHTGTVIARSAQLFAGFLEGIHIPIQVSVDEKAAQQRLESLSALMSKPAKNAGFKLVGPTLVAEPAEIGYTVNIEETLSSMKSNPKSIIDTGILKIVPMPVIPTVTDANQAIQQAERLLDSQIILYAYDPIIDEYKTWAIPREVLAGWLVAEANEQGPQIGLDIQSIENYLVQLSSELEPDRYIEAHSQADQVAHAVGQGKNAVIQIEYHPTSYRVKPGDTLLKISWNTGIPAWIILKANPGIDPEHINYDTDLVIPSKTELLPLPVIPQKRIIISINEQSLSVYQDSQLIGQYMISTGVDRSPTQPGIFQVQTHDPYAYASVWDLYMPHFLGIYEAWPGFLNGIHGLPTLSNGKILWKDVLGRPASYGCIILDLDAAEWLYNWAEDGVVVEIRP